MEHEVKPDTLPLASWLLVPVLECPPSVASQPPAACYQPHPIV